MSDTDLRNLDERLRPFARTAWIPQVEDGDGDPTASEFSGRPEPPHPTPPDTRPW